MPTIPSSTEERRHQMRRLIEQRMRCSVSDLAAQFEVTPATVRSDLTALEQEGYVVRTHGGAIARHALERETLPTERGDEGAKHKIAAKALELIADGDTLAIDTGTTAKALAEALVASPRSNLTIVSSDLEILLMLEAREDFTVVSLGGVIRPGFHYGYGDVTNSALDTVRVDKYFATTSSIDLEKGLTTPNLNTASLKRKMISVAQSVYLMADSSKFGKVSFGHFANLDGISCIIVDDGIPAETLNALKTEAANVLVAS